IASRAPHIAQCRQAIGQLSYFALAPAVRTIPLPAPASTLARPAVPFRSPQGARTMTTTTPSTDTARAVSLIGAPTDVGAGARGASRGPAALRAAGLQPARESHGLAVSDRGNLSGPANPWQPPDQGYRHLPEVVEWNQRVFGAVLAELRLGH